MAAMAVTAERKTVSDHTMAFYHDNFVLITTQPTSSLSAGWTFFFRPFHWLVFVLLACGLLAVTSLLLWLETCHVKTRREGTVDRRDGWSSTLSLVDTAETVFGTMLGRAVSQRPVSSSGCVLLCSWLLMSLVTVATYTSKLTSLSVVTKQRVPFDTLSQLVARSDYRWGVDKGSHVVEILANSPNEDHEKYYRRLLEFAKDDPDVIAKDVPVFLDKLLEGNYVQLSVASAYHYLKADHCQLTLVKERIFSGMYAIHLQKGSPYTASFNDVLEQATETGVLQALRDKWFPDPAGCHSQQTTSVPVSVHLVQTAFYLAAGGLVLAVLCLAGECLHKHGPLRKLTAVRVMTAVRE